jgi:3D (Asp-Asp-Asp) domain-containing protein
MAAARPHPPSAAWRFLAWWFSGLADRRSWFPGVRLLALGAALGLVVGWGCGRILHVLVVEETSLPKPVTSPPPGAAWVHVLTTGYCPCALCCGLFANGHTAINREVATYPFGIAVAPTLIPYREVIEVPGYGTAMVDDTGGAMRQDAALHHIVHLDLRFITHSEARRWGRRWMWISLPADGPAALLAQQP